MASTGSPGSKLVINAANSVTKNRTTRRCDTRRRVIRMARPLPLLVYPHVGRRVPDRQPGERVGAGGALTEDAVHVVARRHGPRRVPEPDVVDLLSEASVEVVVDL